MKKITLLIAIIFCAFGFQAQAQNTPVETADDAQIEISDLHEFLGGGCGDSSFVNTDGGGGPTSQDFEAANDGFDNQAADDFVITGSNSTLCQADIVGTLSAAGWPADPTSTIELYLYEDNGGLPGTEIYTESFDAATTDADNDGIFSLSPTASPILTAGVTYWISVQAQMSFGAGGQWFWNSSFDGNGNAYAWRNPGDGFGTGCTDWTDGGSCIGNGPDLTMNLSFATAGPPNDLIANSIDMDEAGFPYTDPQVDFPLATTEGGNPVDCNIDGANGVWYNFTADLSGPASAEVVDPAGTSIVIWFKAPDENATETDLTIVDQFDNQCLPSTSSEIIVNPGQTYYLFVTNTGGASDVVVNTDTVLGLEEETGIAQFSFYPNPARDAINLNAVDNIEQVTIYNLLGQVVLNENIDSTRGQLNVADLSIGTYLMKVTVNGQVGTYKIMKQ